MRSRRSGRVAALLAAFVLRGAAAHASEWWRLEEARSFEDGEGKVVRMSAVSVDPASSSIRIVSVPFEAGAGKGAEVSLTDLAEILSRSPEHRGKEWILANGGLSSYRVDVPAGLLVVDGKVYSPLSRERSDKRATSSAQPGLRWSGVLCQRAEGGSWDILRSADYAPGACRQALQAGPLLVEPDFTVGIQAEELSARKSYRRTVVCLTTAPRLKLLVSLDETHLLPLAQWLSRPEADGGAGCRVALNLSGDTSSALIVHRAGDAPPTQMGEGSFPLPSAILVEGRQ